MDQWVEIAAKNGLGLLVVVAIGWFFYKKVWPIIEKRMADADTERKELLQRWEEQRKENLERWELQGKLFTEALRLEREDNAKRFDDQGRIFMESLRTQNVLASETHKESMKAQTEITKELRLLNQHLRNGNGK